MADCKADNRNDGAHERTSSAASTTKVRRDYGSGSPLDWENEPYRPGLQGFGKKHNLKIAAPTDSDYESDGSEFSYSGTPTGSPGRMERWKSFKISSLFSRFQRQSTMPNRPPVPESPQLETRSHDDILLKEDSRTYMVSYDAENPVASPKRMVSIRGLIKLCGRDTCGRPIVVIDTSYCPPTYMRFVAVGHIREKMEPIVESGEYNLVFVMSPNPSRADSNNDIPAMWCLEVYRKLPYSYKKNVARVVLIHPTFAVNLVVNLLRPFMSSKAHEKMVRVHRLADLDTASNGEITLDKLYLATHVHLHDKTLLASELDNFTSDG